MGALLHTTQLDLKCIGNDVDLFNVQTQRPDGNISFTLGL